MREPGWYVVKLVSGNFALVEMWKGGRQGILYSIVADPEVSSGNSVGPDDLNGEWNGPHTEAEALEKYFHEYPGVRDRYVEYRKYWARLKSRGGNLL